jgi:hypothetical protein
MHKTLRLTIIPALIPLNCYTSSYNNHVQSTLPTNPSAAISPTFVEEVRRKSKKKPPPPVGWNSLSANLVQESQSPPAVADNLSPNLAQASQSDELTRNEPASLCDFAKEIVDKRSQNLFSDAQLVETESWYLPYFNKTISRQSLQTIITETTRLSSERHHTLLPFSILHAQELLLNLQLQHVTLSWQTPQNLGNLNCDPLPPPAKEHRTESKPDPVSRMGQSVGAVLADRKKIPKKIPRRVRKKKH